MDKTTRLQKKPGVLWTNNKKEETDKTEDTSSFGDWLFILGGPEWEYFQDQDITFDIKEKKKHHKVEWHSSYAITCTITLSINHN